MKKMDDRHSQKLYKQAPALAFRELEDEVLILDARAVQIHQLNSTATFIWQQCQLGASADNICVAVAETFDVGPDVAARDVNSALAHLMQLELIVEIDSRTL